MYISHQAFGCTAPQYDWYQPCDGLRLVDANGRRPQVNYEWIPCKIKVRPTKAKKMLVSVHETGFLSGKEADFLPTGHEL
jgi:hypothetical protein